MTKLADSFDMSAGQHYGVLVNGLGATPLMEQYVFANDVAKLLAEKMSQSASRKLVTT